MIVDLRSDTVTRPTAAMLRAMVSAELGDDVYGEDPSARKLEQETADLLGKEAALFVPSGTMANQIAILLHCRRGDGVIVGEGAHCMVHESGAGAAWAGVQFQVAGRGGLFDAEALREVVQPAGELTPRSKLCVFENTHASAGGAIWPDAQSRAVSSAARSWGLAIHVDGARLWNAAAATGRALPTLVDYADTVSVSFSKGLGAPVGSALVGSRAAMQEARRFRKMLGGGMRQVGVLCAAALHALGERERLPEDHALARRFAEGLADLPSLEVKPVETNIVLIDTPDYPAAALAEALRREQVLLHAVGKHRLRAVTHRDLGGAHVDAAIAVFRRLLGT